MALADHVAVAEAHLNARTPIFGLASETIPT
jgi:hypothetical protein